MVFFFLMIRRPPSSTLSSSSAASMCIRDRYKSDLDAFMAHEQLRNQEEQLKTMMVWHGRGGMWEDWLNFQAQCARARKEEEEERQRARRLRKKRIVDILTWTAVGGSIIGSIGLVIWIFILISNHTS